MNFKQYTKEFKYNLKLATPVVMGMLGHTLVGFIDNIMVGKINPTSLAAVSLGNSIIFFAMSFGIGFSTAITTLIAETQGENNFRQGKSILKHGILINALLSLILLLIVHLAKPLMHLTGQDPDVIALATPYINLVSISLIPLMFFLSFEKFATGFSLTKISMYVTLIGNLINIILNYIFIYGNFGMPQLGVLGAGVGTLASRIAMPFLIWLFLYKNSITRKYVVRFNWISISTIPIKKIITIGIPSSLQMVFEAGLFIAATWLSGVLGKNFQAANQIALTLGSMTFMIPSGMSVAAMVRIGYLKGKKDFINLRRVAISIFIFVIMTQIILAFGYIIFGSWIPELFIDKTNLKTLADVQFVIANASSLLIIAGIFQIPDGLQIVFLGALRGMQDVKIPMFINFIAYWIIAFPTSYFLGLHTSLENIGIWIGLLIGLSSAAIMLMFRFFYFSKKLN